MTKEEYSVKLREIRFSFNPDSLLDYQVLLSLIDEVYKFNYQDELNLEILNTIQLLVLIYDFDNDIKDNLDDIISVLSNEIITYKAVFSLIGKDLSQEKPVISKEHLDIISILLNKVEAQLIEGGIENIPPVIFTDVKVPNSQLITCISKEDVQSDNRVLELHKDEFILNQSNEEKYNQLMEK